MYKAHVNVHAGSGFIDKQEFDAAYPQLFPDAGSEEAARVFDWMQSAGGRSGQVDYVSWCQRLSLTQMPEYARRISTSGGAGDWRSRLAASVLTSEEVGLVEAMRGRLDALARAAATKRVKLMVDAEHTYFQPVGGERAMLGIRVRMYAWCVGCGRGPDFIAASPCVHVHTCEVCMCIMHVKWCHMYAWPIVLSMLRCA